MIRSSYYYIIFVCLRVSDRVDSIRPQVQECLRFRPAASKGRDRRRASGRIVFRLTFFFSSRRA